MNEWSLGHSQHGFIVSLAEVPWWAKAVTAGFDRLMVLLGHPCCDGYPSGRWTIWGWIINHLVPTWPTWTKRYDDDEVETNPRESVAVLQFRLLNNPLAHFAYRHEKNRHTLPISDGQAAQISAEFAAEMDEMFPPSERPALTSTAIGSVQTTWTYPPAGSS